TCVLISVQLTRSFFQWSLDLRDLHSFPTRRSSDLAGVTLTNIRSPNLDAAAVGVGPDTLEGLPVAVLVRGVDSVHEQRCSEERASGTVSGPGSGALSPHERLDGVAVGEAVPCGQLLEVSPPKLVHFVSGKAGVNPRDPSSDEQGGARDAG